MHHGGGGGGGFCSDEMWAVAGVLAARRDGG
jgi:hypothetical protein